MTTYYPGQGFTLYTDFDETLDHPPKYTVRRDSDRALVQEGLAEQDASQTSRWTAEIVLPQSVTPGTYTLEWSASADEVSLKSTERLTVGSATSEYFELDKLVMEDQPLMDILTTDNGQTVSDVTATLRSETGEVIASVSGQEIDGGYSATFPAGVQSRNGVFAVYILEWVATIDGARVVEYHFVYVSTYKVLLYVNELRRMIDKAQLQHKNPALKYNDVDLVAFLNLGLQTVNASPPTQTSYGLNAIPDALYSYVLKAAAVEALDARYLAEAEAAFSFNGGGAVSLDVDRTGFLESAREHYKSALEDLKSVKKGIVMATGGSSGGRAGIGNSAGVLVLVRSPSLDYTGMHNSLYTYLRPGSRAILYDELLANL